MKGGPLAVLGAAAVAAACGQPETATSRPPRTPPVPVTTFALQTGLKLALVPNLPGVENADFPDAARREVEVLGVDARALRLLWTGSIRVEKAATARRREDWVRARSNSPASATPLPAVPPDYEERTVGGELFFPDFTSATSFLVPGLWPEGNATFAGSTALWIAKGAFRDLLRRREAKVPLTLGARFLKEPASLLLRRASELTTGDGGAEAADLWKAGAPRRYSLRLDGQSVEVEAVPASSWLGTFEILADEENPLVLALLPSPARSPVLDLFAPVKVLKTLLGYRVAEVTTAATATAATAGSK
jgi:hypothetical protein